MHKIRPFAKNDIGQMHVLEMENVSLFIQCCKNSYTISRKEICIYSIRVRNETLTTDRKQRRRYLHNKPKSVISFAVCVGSDAMEMTR